MFEEDLRRRANRLISGDFRTEDLDRLFLGQRDRAHNCPCFREIGDFIAHRDIRDRGLVSKTGRDVLTSVDVWSRKLRGHEPSLEDFIRAAHANLRLASDDLVRNSCNSSRKTANKILKRVSHKLDQNQLLTDHEYNVLVQLGGRFIWKPAFSSEQLFSEFSKVLTKNGLVEEDNAEGLSRVREFLTLHALAVMHGSSILLENGKKAKLYAGFANEERRLEVKIEIVFSDWSKTLMTPICLFLTDLKPEDYCDSNLYQSDDHILYNHWNKPIEVSGDNRLTWIS